MKSAKFTVSQILELILSVAAVFLLIALMAALFLPGFNKLDRGSEGYFNTLLEQIAIADEGGEGEFSLWQPTGKKKTDFFLIYFGDRFKFSAGDRTFLSMGRENRLCVCYWDGSEGICDYCEELKYPASYDGVYDEPWIIATGEQVSIVKGENQYEFVKTEK